MPANTTKKIPLRWFPAIALLGLIVVMVATPRNAPEAEAVDRIENGLLTTVVIKGRLAPMKLVERMAYYGVPGMSIAVINNGQLAWAKGYGVLEAGGARRVTSETRFQAASISKSVTAMAALALVQRGILKLDEDVNRTLTSWRVPENEFTKNEKVTLRRLLNHSAGLGRDDVGSYAAGEALPSLVQALDGRAPANLPPLRVEAEPGSRWSYSGGGYSVIQQMMIDTGRQPFPELTKGLVLDKLGMNSSDFHQPLREDWKNIAASGHDANGQPIVGRWRTFPEMAAAGLWTTPSDLTRFAIEVQQSWQGKSTKVLSAQMTRLMLTKQLGHYGLGVWLGGQQTVRSFGHPGANEGFTCILTASLESGQGAVVMTNGDRGSGLFNEVLRAIAREYGWSEYQPIEKTVASVDSDVYQAYVGVYQASGLPDTTITTDVGQLYISSSPLGPRRVNLYPSTEDRFFMLESDIEVSFVKDVKGNVTGLHARAGGQNFLARRVN
jgi:CubicO group peptidase (beta-lactamase class C family)